MSHKDERRNIGIETYLVLTRRGASLCPGAHPYGFRTRSWGGRGSSHWRPFEFMEFFSCLPYESYTLTGWTTMEMWSEVSLGFLSSLAFRLALYSQIVEALLADLIHSMPRAFGV